ncbi:hypothetical protein [Nonomuraea jabiensis]|uniref:Uncharacterized protein n=1 Tax=Nonomuraea jabiensis TaxID=882448 RepID=A0A7W9GIH4_9ACTN|nr:hypothetical protein [Nonomuraea jabiensis]MBB5784425.1 hypothetical protein [Nonomuraea jabiensis]
MPGLPASFAAKLIEFVGDSITVGTTTPKNALTADGCVGLEARFPQLNPNAATPDWNFSRYQADAGRRSSRWRPSPGGTPRRRGPRSPPATPRATPRQYDRSYSLSGGV